MESAPGGLSKPGEEILRLLWSCVRDAAIPAGIESDIATVITFSAADNWLRDGGTIAFLITWTVFKSASAKGFRQAKLPRGSELSFETIEDLTALQPFPDATNETRGVC